eukprot:NODE_416_length_7838_cov_1.514537.p5 type:complete len:237 gc:universal NODE_416_length_7838_cov_1.514537:3207-2497(-)
MQKLVEEFIGKYSGQVIGLCGPQGCGKTTLVESLKSSLPIGLDDFYFPQEKLARLSLEGNPFYKKRGLPGTHDVDLLNDAISILKSGKIAEVPIFDKRLKNGLGDRNGSRKAQLDDNQNIILEGWCVGFEPTILEIESWFTKKDCDQVMENLTKYNIKIWSMLDMLIVIRTSDLRIVSDWRYEQELCRNQGMSKMEVEKFVAMFLPLYKCNIKQNIPTLTITIDHNRQVISYKIKN